MWLIDFILHIDLHLAEMAQTMGPWLYLILFVIIFAETGLVVTPILPGDSLLFAAGALAALADSVLDVHLLVVLLIVAGIIGDTVNYTVGHYLGPKVFSRPDSWLMNKKHLIKAQMFYEKHGAFTIVMARFVPIVRTFAPFVAGVGRMRYGKFIAYNVGGAIAWVTLFVYGGYFFGNLPLIKRNFHIAIIAIIVLSILPIIVEWWRNRRLGVAPQGQ